MLSLFDKAISVPDSIILIVGSSPLYPTIAFKTTSNPDNSHKSIKTKKYNTTLWLSLPDQPGKLGEVTSMIGYNNVNISSVEMTEKTAKSINFRFNLIIHDLKNFTKLISELKQKEFNFKIIRHKNKKYAFFKRLFSGFKKN